MTSWHRYFYVLVVLSTIAFALTILTSFWKVAALLMCVAAAAWLIRRFFSPGR